MLIMQLQEQVKKTLLFLAERIGEYYRKASIWLPEDFALREFAYQPWTSESYVRHLSFSSYSSIKEFLVKYKPRHFYYSSARYDQPGLPDMDAKGWRSADLTFDIDADHLSLCSDKIVSIKTVHGKEVTLVDEQCIRLAALETSILVDVLVEELGFSEKNISVEFSGNRGFHVTVYLSDNDERARAGQDYRREVVNYIKAIGLLEETINPLPGISLRRRALQPVPFTVYMAGVRGRIARIAKLVALREGKPHIAAIFSEKDPVQAASLYHKNREEAEQFISKAIELARIEVDEQVTVDLKRLIRVPGSINGKTGLIVSKITPKNLPDFVLNEELSPFKDHDALRVKMLADLPTTVTILGNKLGLNKGTTARLPAPIAFYLMSRELAILEE